jgi:hypothetical protein
LFIFFNFFHISTIHAWNSFRILKILKFCQFISDVNSNFCNNCGCKINITNNLIGKYIDNDIKNYYSDCFYDNNKSAIYLRITIKLEKINYKNDIYVICKFKSLYEIIKYNEQSKNEIEKYNKLSNNLNINNSNIYILCYHHDDKFISYSLSDCVQYKFLDKSKIYINIDLNNYIDYIKECLKNNKLEKNIICDSDFIYYVDDDNKN